MKNSNRSKLTTKEIFDIAFGIVQITLIVVTIFFALKAYQQTNNIFKAQSRPNMIVTENSADSTYHLMLWNMGPGVAYDIKVETHFADNIGNVGVVWIKDVIEAAIGLENKTDSIIYINMNTSSLGTTNPPNTMPVGIEFSYKTKPAKYHTLSGMIVIIRYKDNLGDSYYSFWDGYNWTHSSGVFKTPQPAFPKLNPYTPVSQFKEMLLTYKLENYLDMMKLWNRLLLEEDYLRLHGVPSFSDDKANPNQK